MAQNVGLSREVKVAGAGVMTASAQTLEKTSDSTTLTPPGGSAVPVTPPPIAAPAVPSASKGHEQTLAAQDGGAGTVVGEAKHVPAREVQPAPVPVPDGGGRADITPLAPGGDGSTESPANVVAASGDAKKEPVSPTVPPAEKDMPAQPVNNRRVTLEYEVAKFGPSGIGTVDLYMTQDDGQNWQKVEARPGPAVPSRPGEPMRRTMSLDLGQDGSYGFTLVVHSKAGKSRAVPRSSEAPQMRLELDTTPPVATLFAPLPSPTQREVLVLKWEAKDKNLGSRPVTLEWAEQPQAEWKLIGDKQLPNTGSYTWKVPEGIPPQVYLRLTVRDSAGNVAVAETQKAFPIDLVEPEAHFTGFVRAGNP
jgi:hypothetical protein